MRRTSSSSERSLDPAYGAEYEYGQLPDDYPAPRSISPLRASPGRLSPTPIATLSELAEAIVTAPDGGKDSGADGGEEDLEKLEEIVRKGEGVTIQLKQDAYHGILAAAKAPHHNAEDSLARRIKALKLSFELYYLLSRAVDLELLLEFLDEKEEKILAQTYASLPNLLHFCLLSASPLSKIKTSLLSLLPLTLPPTPPTALTFSIQSFAFHLLKKSPQNLIPDLFLQHNAQNHSALLWLTANYPEVLRVLGSASAGRIQKEVDSAMRSVFEGDEWAERIVRFWKDWVVRAGASTGRLEAVNAWLGGPELAAAGGLPSSSSPAPPKRSPQSTPPPAKRPRLNPIRRTPHKQNPAAPYPPRSAGTRTAGYQGRRYDPDYRARPAAARRNRDALHY
ncbi:MAG: hypothetical protein M1839_008144 [Geoglossum umbratile]|nr:MAG: hypothetical protein M1839_008144 [Geoglossum umbratile]